MCQEPPISWMLIRIMRCFASRSDFPSTDRHWLEERQLGQLAALLPPLIDIFQASGQNCDIWPASLDQAPSPMEQKLLKAVACALCEPWQSEQLLRSMLPPASARMAEDIVIAVACVLQEQSCQRRRPDALRASARARLH